MGQYHGGDGDQPVGIPQTVFGQHLYDGGDSPFYLHTGADAVRSKIPNLVPAVDTRNGVIGIGDQVEKSPGTINHCAVGIKGGDDLLGIVMEGINIQGDAIVKDPHAATHNGLLITEWRQPDESRSRGKAERAGNALLLDSDSRIE